VRSLGVFCGSNAGRGDSYRAAAGLFGREVARRRITLVYGGGHVGLMGVVADAALAAGGRVIGVLPRFLHEREVGHAGLSELHLVDSMHERKARMAELSDAFVALPGGLGTLEEIFEAWTWMQLGLQHKPCGLLAVGTFFDPLLEFLDRISEQGFVTSRHRALLKVASDPAVLLSKLASAEQPAAAVSGASPDADRL
jgi:uncharacterized protein (TIGR00730 family)